MYHMRTAYFVFDHLAVCFFGLHLNQYFLVVQMYDKFVYNHSVEPLKEKKGLCSETLGIINNI